MRPWLVLVGAAKISVSGKDVGLDIWKKNVESGNSPEAALENALGEGASSRVQVGYGDVRELPLKSTSFDVVLGRAFFHHIHSMHQRERTIKEMICVLKPRGFLGIIIVDFMNIGKYLEMLQKCGILDSDILEPRIHEKIAKIF